MRVIRIRIGDAEIENFRERGNEIDADADIATAIETFLSDMLE